MRISAAITLLLLAGCASVSSTALNRSDSDHFYGNSNGDSGSKGQTRPFKGIPITVRVPTHVDIAIREKVRLAITGDGLVYLKSPKRHLFVESEIVYTDEVFTVDPKRPGAGTLDYNIAFGGLNDDYDNRQYFKTIKSTIQDNTLKDVTAAVQTVLGAVSTSADSTEEVVPANFFTELRTVAWSRFDVDAVDFEDQVRRFVDQHLNCCNSCLAYTAGAIPVTEPTSDQQSGTVLIPEPGHKL